MLSVERDQAILACLSKQGTVSVGELSNRLNVSEITIRRDLQRLESVDKLRRVRGGAVKASDTPESGPPTNGAVLEQASAHWDAIILPPMQNRAVRALRARAKREGKICIAESAPQDGAIYLGPDNKAAGRKAGEAAGAKLKARTTITAMLITHAELPNTRERCDGFLEGLTAATRTTVTPIYVDGEGLYAHAYKAVAGVLSDDVQVDVLFGVNDHSILAGVEAWRQTMPNKPRPLAYCVGGEGNVIFDALAHGDVIDGCVALFPERVATAAVDTIARSLGGVKTAEAIVTPHQLVTIDNLAEVYRKDNGRWLPLEGTLNKRAIDVPAGKSLCFVIHFPNHQWYRNMATAMEARARQLGIDFATVDANDEFAREVSQLRREIAHTAAALVGDARTLILGSGDLAEEIAAHLTDGSGLTVITNSIPAFERLRGTNGIKVLLTGGEYERGHDALVGPAAAAVLEDLRADLVLLTADGISIEFGVSHSDERVAEISRRMMDAARRTIVLADHAMVDVDSRFRVANIDEIDVLVTDLGILPPQRLNLMNRGIKLELAGQVIDAIPSSYGLHADN